MKKPVKPARAASLATGTMNATVPLVTPAAIRMSSKPMAPRDGQHDKSQQSQQQFPVTAPDPPFDIGRNVDLNAVVFADHRCEPKGSGPVVTGGNELSRTLRSNFVLILNFLPAERAENCSHIEPSDTLLCLRIADAQIQNSVLPHPEHGFLRRFESVPHVPAAITKLTFGHLTILSQRLLSWARWMMFSARAAATSDPARSEPNFFASPPKW